MRSSATRRWPRCPRRSSLMISRHSSRCCSRTHECARSRTLSLRGRSLPIRIRRSTSWKNRAKPSSRGRAPSATAVRVSRHRRHPSFGTTTIATQCPRPVDPVSPARFAFAPCPPRLARNARTYEIVLSVPTPSPAGLLPAGTKIRRPSSDPGRALVTGFVGGRSASWMIGTSSMCPVSAASAERRRTSTTTARPHSKRSSTTTSSSSRLAERSSPLASSRQWHRPTASTSIGRHARKNGPRCWRTCASCRGRRRQLPVCGRLW